MRKSIYVPLTWEEFVKLREVALNECRDPREHARYLVRVGLGMADPENKSGARVVLADPGTTVGLAG